MSLSLRNAAVAALALLAGTFIAPPASAVQDHLVWRGDQATGRTIMREIAGEYAKQKRGTIELQPFSTISGLDAVAQGKADLAGSARGKDPDRPEEANLEFIPAALDAAVMITHPGNPVANLTMYQLYEIYFGRITNWKELGGADRPINLYAIAAPLDGIEYSLRQLVFKNGGKRVAAPRLYLNTGALEQAIAIDPAGLGLSTLGGVHANAGVRMIDVEGVTPSPATVADGSYPLFITLYLVERADDFHQDVIDRFRDFADSPGVKDILRRHQLVPWSDVADVAANDAARLTFIDERLRGERTAALAAASAQAAQATAAAAAQPAEAAGAPVPASPAVASPAAPVPAAATGAALPKAAPSPAATPRATPAVGAAAGAGAAGGN